MYLLVLGRPAEWVERNESNRIEWAGGMVAWWHGCMAGMLAWRVDDAMPMRRCDEFRNLLETDA